MTENVIEFLTNQKQATLTLSQGRFITKIEKLAKKHPEECIIEARNKDGSIVAVVPVSWIKISPPKQVSEEQRMSAAERMKQMHSSKSMDTMDV